MSESFSESIKNIFALIGIGTIIYLAITMLPPFYNQERYESACADRFGTFSFKWVDEKFYCEVSEDKWNKHPYPPKPIKYNIFGQEIE